MGKAEQKKRRKRHILAVTGEHPRDLQGKEGEKRWMRQDKETFRKEISTLKQEIDRSMSEEGETDLLPNWTPLFERFRSFRLASVLQEQWRVEKGMSKATELLAKGYENAVSMMQTMLQLVSTCLNTSDLYLFAESAFAMSAYLQVGDVRLSSEVLPRKPVWIEYEHPKRMRSDVPTATTAAFWFFNPLQASTVTEAMKRGALSPEMYRLAAPLATEEEQHSWMLEVYSAELGPLAVLRYHIPSARWLFTPGHVAVCPQKKCILEKLVDDKEFVVACEGCQAARERYTRVFVTSLLLQSGLFRAVREGDQEQTDHEKDGTPSYSQPQKRDADNQEQTASDVSVARNQLTSPAKRYRMSRGYSIIEFDASLRPRTKPHSRTKRTHWAQGHEILDLVHLNMLDQELPDETIISVDLEISGVTRYLHAERYKKKRWQTITVKSYMLKNIKMTYGTYRRRLQNKRITKVVATRFAGIAIEVSGLTS